MMNTLDRIEIRFLSEEERKTLKKIRLSKQIGTRTVWAELIYSRDTTPIYFTKYQRLKTNNGLFYDIDTLYPEDEFDKMVLHAVRTKYPDAQMCSLDVNTDSCIDRLSIMYEGYHKDEAVVYLIPDLSQIDPYSVNQRQPLYRFSVKLEVYAPCIDYINYFKNEGYFDYYDIDKMADTELMLERLLPTKHQMDDLWKK